MNSPDLVAIIEIEAAPSFEEELQEEEEDGELAGIGDRNWERESTQDIKNDAHPGQPLLQTLPSQLSRKQHGAHLGTHTGSAR